MPMLPLDGFAGGTDKDRSANISVARTVNLYPEQTAAGWVLRLCPGYEEVAELAEGPVRGLKSINGRTFAVGGSAAYEIDEANYTVTNKSGVSDDGRAVSFLTNGEAGSQVGIVSNSLLFVLDLSDPGGIFLPVTSFPPSRVAVFIDNYGVALAASTSTIALSALNDLTSWDPIDVQQRSMGADRTITLGVNHRDLLVFGETTSEAWYNDPNQGALYPLVPRDGVFLEVGSAAARSGANVGNTFHWLGQSAQGGRTAYRLNGYTAQPISTHAIEQAWAEYAVVDDAVGVGILWEGHAWYQLSFPSERKTWVFDTTTGAWHERLTWHSETGEYDGFRGLVHTVTARGEHLIGGQDSSKIYRLSPSVYADDVSPLRWLRRTPHVTKNRERITYRAAQLDMETGRGLTTGQGSDPQIMLRWSSNDGHSWGMEHWRTAGAIGEYETRVKWNRLGQSRARTFEIAGSDPVPTTLLNLLVDAG